MLWKFNFRGHQLCNKWNKVFSCLLKDASLFIQLSRFIERLPRASQLFIAFSSRCLKDPESCSCVECAMSCYIILNWYIPTSSHAWDVCVSEPLSPGQVRYRVVRWLYSAYSLNLAWLCLLATLFLFSSVTLLRSGTPAGSQATVYISPCSVSYIQVNNCRYCVKKLVTQQIILEWACFLCQCH